MKPRDTPSEKRYTSKRENLLKKIGRAEIADNFPLYVRRQRMVALLSRYELFKLALPVQGSIVECGVHKGASLMLFAQLSAIYEPYSFNREIIGFDTFEGFPHVSSGKDRANARVGDMANVDLKLIKEAVGLYDLNRPLGHVPKVALVKGDAMVTIPKYLKDNPHTLISLLYLDFDLHAPTKAALEALLPRMPRGAVLAFDELNTRQWPGETTALLEAMNVRDIELKKFPGDPYTSYAILR